MMITSDYTTSLVVDQSPQEVFNTINNVDQWWTQNLEGTAQNVNDEFTVDFPGIHLSTQKVVELIPGRKVKWLVTDSNLTSLQDKQEWTGTAIQFDITPTGDKTRIQFTHVGLVPDLACYNACTSGWTYYIDGSLYKLLTAGKGQPGKSLPKGEVYEKKSS